MEFIPTALKEVMRIRPRVFEDQRGFFTETFRLNVFHEAGIQKPFVQDNISGSVQNTLRGLHYQIMRPQAKLVMVIRGQILDVAVDLRQSSPTFGTHVVCRLSEQNKEMLYIPEGFAHGFFVLSEWATFLYKCSDYYHPEGERGIRWDDPEIGIAWPGSEPFLSEKDRKLPFLSDIDSESLPK